MSSALRARRKFNILDKITAGREYDGERGFKTIFLREKNTKRRRNTLCCMRSQFERDDNYFGARSEASRSFPTPSCRFDLRSDGDCTDMRFQDVGFSIESHEHLRNLKQRESKKRAELQVEIAG